MDRCIYLWQYSITLARKIPVTHGPTRREPSATDYYSNFFKPSYDAFLGAAKQTPLVIMLWGPRRPSLAWSKTRLQIRNTLQQLGHTVYLSEQLGIPAAASTQKAVEYLQRDAADLIIGIQHSYGLVGTISQFVEFRVIDSKMLLFIDAAAPDNYLYDRAVAELKNLYDNVETYELPDDIVRDKLLRKIVAKVGLMQIVKHRAIQRARGWSLRLDSEPANAPIAPLQPFRYNLLELYREHRDEIDALNDLMRLFFLAYLNDAGRIPLTAFSKDVGLAEASLLQQLAPLLRGEMISHTNGVLVATAYGQRMLDGLNLAVRAAPPPPPVLQTPRILPPIMRTRLATFTAGAGLVLAAIFLFILALINSVNPVQNQQPLVLTPLRPSITATATLIPAPSQTPALPSR
jgi:hypothetical protein